jgi:hypothetical protein
MRKSVCLIVLTIGALGIGTRAVADADDRDDRHGVLRARLRAANEVPVVISNAKGEFRATVDSDAQTIDYELSYEGLEGAVSQAHIHVGQPFASGGIAIWLCANQPNPNAPAGTQPCPAAPATITGSIAPANVVGPAGQAIPAGSFEDAIEAIRSGNAYVNVHSTSAPGGEVRGQIR